MSSSIPRTSGIYQILCVPTGKVYVGSAINLRKRKSGHFARLRRGIHDNSYLQHAWNKYGEVAFEFKVLELVLAPWLLEREQYWLDKLKVYDRRKGFNIQPTAGSPAGLTGWTHSAEARAKISLAHKGRKKSEEHRANLRASRQAHPRKHSEETRRKMSAAHKGRPARSPSEETRRKLSLANLGKTHTTEARAKISAYQKGRPKSPEERAAYRLAAQGRRPSEAARLARSKRWIVIDPDGNEQVILSLRQFCLQNGLNDSHMRDVANGIQRQHRGWKCRLIGDETDAFPDPSAVDS